MVPQQTTLNQYVSVFVLVPPYTIYSQTSLGSIGLFRPFYDVKIGLIVIIKYIAKLHDRKSWLGSLIISL